MRTYLSDSDKQEIRKYTTEITLCSHAGTEGTKVLEMCVGPGVVGPVYQVRSSVKTKRTNDLEEAMEFYSNL